MNYIKNIIAPVGWYRDVLWCWYYHIILNVMYFFRDNGLFWRNNIRSLYCVKNFIGVLMIHNNITYVIQHPSEYVLHVRIGHRTTILSLCVTHTHTHTHIQKYKTYFDLWPVEKKNVARTQYRITRIDDILLYCIMCWSVRVPTSRPASVFWLNTSALTFSCVNAVNSVVQFKS